jgi:hypothetical protein
VANTTVVLIRSPEQMVSCPQGSATLAFRGDTGACVGVSEIDGPAVHWHEAGQYFEALFLEGISLDQGLAWVET